MRPHIPELVPNGMNKKLKDVLPIYKSLYHRIKEKVKIIRDLYTTEYGTLEFIIQDCNGFALIFAEWVGIKDFYEKTVKKKE